MSSDNHPIIQSRGATLALENRIVDRILTTACAAGYSIAVYDGEQFTVENTTDRKVVKAALRSSSDDYLYFCKGGVRRGWVFLVWGNGTDVITDSTAKIDSLLTPARRLAEQLASEPPADGSSLPAPQPTAAKALWDALSAILEDPDAIISDQQRAAGVAATTAAHQEQSFLEQVARMSTTDEIEGNSTAGGDAGDAIAALDALIKQARTIVGHND